MPIFQGAGQSVCWLVNLLLKMGLIKVDGLLAREFIQDGGRRTWLVKDDVCTLKKVTQMRQFQTNIYMHVCIGGGGNPR